MSVGKPEATGVAEGEARMAEVTEASGKAEISKAGKVVTGAEGDETTEGVGVAKVMMGKCGGEAVSVTIVGKAGMATGGATEGTRGEAKAKGGGVMTEVDKTEVTAMTTVGNGEMAAEAGDVGTVTVMEDKAGNGERETEDWDWARQLRLW
ncbi:hypothetical protein F5148DRAFT_1151813 [Russula earlei]|uniref:Uncharacterized protein n=1 Tax=Russula earlei TaxID=71964 RepID=A0ACC0TZS0_9AGAM|nr:hypothetical protein F5148DRAFT_1151813 [Russula earlei]